MRILYLSADPKADHPALDSLKAALLPAGADFRSESFTGYRRYFEKDVTTGRKAPVPPEVVFLDLEGTDHDPEALAAFKYISRQIQSVTYAVNSSIWQKALLEQHRALVVGPQDLPRAIATIQSSHGSSSAPPSFEP